MFNVLYTQAKNVLCYVKAINFDTASLHTFTAVFDYLDCNENYSGNYLDEH
jgi:hypothetical protein